MVGACHGAQRRARAHPFFCWNCFSRRFIHLTSPHTSGTMPDMLQETVITTVEEESELGPIERPALTASKSDEEPALAFRRGSVMARLRSFGKKRAASPEGKNRKREMARGRRASRGYKA